MSSFDSISAKLGDLSSNLQSLARNASRTQIIATAAIATGIPLARYLQVDYNAWYSLGKGGVPHNFYGYLIVKALGLLGVSDIYGSKVYDEIAAANAKEGKTYFDGPLPQRAGIRPRVSRWAFPIRQLSDHSPENVKAVGTRSDMRKTDKFKRILTDWKLLDRRIKGFAEANAIVVRAQPSLIERGTHPNSIQIIEGYEDPKRFYTKLGPSETYHFHPSDGSGHMMLSAADCKTVLETGWGERHALSGSPGPAHLPVNYLMIYAPRSEDEVAVHELIARASARYALLEGNKLATTKV